jgi:hypothetical protein
LQYPDGPHNAEALFVDRITGNLFITTKEDDRSRIYQADASALTSSSAALTLIGEVPFELVSGGDISPDGREIILRRENAARSWTRAGGQTVGQALSGPGTEVPVVGPPEEPNGEALTFHSDNSGYYTISEGEDPPIYFFARLGTPTFDGLPTRVSGGWELKLRGCAGTQVRIEWSPDLSGWNQLATVTLGAGQTTCVFIAWPSSTSPLPVAIN